LPARLQARPSQHAQRSHNLKNLLLHARRFAGHVRRFLLNPRIRAENLARLRYRERLFQAATFTRQDRYPELFEECRRQLQNLGEPHILSFGCSVGDELSTLRRYLPNSRIAGVDMNPWCLRECMRRGFDPRVRMLHRLSPEFLELDDLDSIFCLAVFQRTEHRINGVSPAESGFTFELFERELQVLDRKLKPGGLLFLDECDFAFQMTAVAQHYRPLRFEGSEVLRERPLFDRTGGKIASSSLFLRAFQKLEG
jgi:hypothetical protein